MFTGFHYLWWYIYYAYCVSLEYNVSLFQGFCDFCLFLGFHNLTMKSLIAFLCVYFGVWWVPPNTWSALLVIYRKILAYVSSNRFFAFILSLLLVSTHRIGHLTVSISHWELFISFQCFFSLCFNICNYYFPTFIDFFSSCVQSTIDDI